MSNITYSTSRCDGGMGGTNSRLGSTLSHFSYGSKQSFMYLITAKTAINYF